MTRPRHARCPSPAAPASAPTAHRRRVRWQTAWCLGLSLAGGGMAWAQAAPDATQPPAAATAPTESRAPAEEPVVNSALDATMFYQLLIGELEAQSGRQANAYEVMLDAARRTRDPGLFQRAIELAVQGRSADRAVAAARAWRTVQPESVEAARTELQLLVATERTADITGPLRELIQLTPLLERPGLISSVPRFLASLPDKARTWAAAEPALERFTQERGTRVAAWSAMGRLALAAEREDQALSLARKAAADDPAAPAPVLLAMEMLGRQPAAEVLVQGHLARPDALPAMRLAYARALDQRQRLAEAEAQLAQAVQQQPDLPQAWLTLAAYRLELHEPQAAVDALQRYLALQTAPTGAGAGGAPANPHGGEDEEDSAETGRHLAYALMAQAQEQLGREAGVVEWLDKIPADQVDLSALSRRAAWLARQGRLTEGRALLRGAPARGEPDARLRLMAEAQLLRDHQQPQAAYDLLLGAVRQTPEDSTLLYELAMTAERLQRHDDMEALLRRVMALKPDDAHAANALGYSLADRNLRLPEARQLLERAARLAPTDPFITDSLGWLAFREGRLDEALVLLQRSMAARPHVEVAAHLGEVLWALGRQEEALRVLREGQRREPGNEVLRATLARLQVKL